MTRITYMKHFTTGNLKGITVPGGFAVPDGVSAAQAVSVLKMITKENTARDAGTGCEYFVYLVGAENVIEAVEIAR